MGSNMGAEGFLDMGQKNKILTLRSQCPKLRVHPAPGAHIFTAGCTISGGVHPVCARFLSQLL